MRLFIFFLLFSALSATQIKLGNEILDCEIANTPSQIAKGLMDRDHLPEGTGMLFVYEKSQKLVFWMKNTYIPLSIGFFDDSQVLMKILDMDPPIGQNFIRYRSMAPARYALEVPQGWFEKHKIRIGDKFSFVVE